MRTLNVHIAEDNDGVWRIRDNRGRGHGTIRAKKADQIFWTTRKYAMVFTFPKAVDAYFDFDEGMFEDGRSQRIGANKKLRLNILDSAPADTLEYQVYVEEAGKYVVGNSPPVLIINRSQ